MTSSIYLDYNATAPLLPQVKQAMVAAMDDVGNPSSIHGYGRNIRKHIEHAREKIAQLVKCDPTHITFTSGATESNNWVLFGAPVERILISAIEHSSIYDLAKEKKNIAVIPVLKNGVIDLNALESALQSDPRKTLVSVMWVNNETGVIQPIKEIAMLAKKYGALFHTDAVQAAGRVNIDLQKTPIDYLSLSAHKIGGPTGVGALIYGHEIELNTFIRGGGQERRRRAGTENTLGIIGFGEAAEIAKAGNVPYETLGKWRDELETRMLAAVPAAVIIGKDAARVANTIQVILPGATSEKQLIAFDLAGIAVSSGSACSSGSIKPSHVLQAMGISDALAKCAIRVSIGLSTQKNELDSFFQAWVVNSQRLRVA